MEVLTSLVPVAVRPAAGHLLLLARQGPESRLTLFTDDAGIDVVTPDAGVSAVQVWPVIDEDGTVFVAATTNFERPQVSLLRPPRWAPDALAAPFGARVGVDPVADVATGWGGGRGVVAWREGRRLFIATCE